jgi:hypothetical protein
MMGCLKIAANLWLSATNPITNAYKRLQTLKNGKTAPLPIKDNK